MNIKGTEVRPPDERPARRDGTCFYCSQPMGGQHKPDCVVLQKSVVVKITMEMDVVVDVPRSWDEGQINFYFNESSYCVDNMLKKLGDWADNNGSKCACHAVEIFHQRDATQEDHEHLPVLIKDEASD